MNNDIFLSGWIKRFLVEYLVNIKNLSRNTQQSYRDTFRLFLPFVAEKSHKHVDQLLLEDMAADCLKQFLQDLELKRKCSIATRNQRLAAVHAFAQFVGLDSPIYVEWCRQICLVPFKKAPLSLITYLEKDKMNALLNAPNRSTAQGQRDYALLLFLYNTGARADEAAQLKIEDLDLANNEKKNFSIVVIRGKGDKLRRCPLWSDTVKELNLLIEGREQTEHVFLNRLKAPITRFGIHSLVKRYVKQIIPEFPSLKTKRVSPHTIRHTTATHLLHFEVDINTIRAWLGHVSINTTNIYVEIDLEMKAKA